MHRRGRGDYRISTSLLPRDAPGQREQLARRLAAGDTGIDIMSLDPPFIPEFAEAGWLAELPSDVADAAVDGVLESAVEASTWRDELVAVPFWANTQLLWYRISVAESAGLDPENEPVTWEQLIEAAEAEDTFLAVQGIREEALTVWINALVASADGVIIENPEAPAEEVQLGLESEAGEQAAEVIQDSLEQAAPRPQTPYYNEVSEGIQTTWHPPASVRPETSPAAATTLITEVLRGERPL